MHRRENPKHSIRALYNRYSAVMFGAAYRILHDQQLAEDAVQQSFEKILENVKRMPDDDNSTRTKTFMAIVARNTARDILRKKTAVIHVPYEDEQLSDTLLDHDPLELLLEQENLQKLHTAIDQLPDKYGDVLKLRFVYDLEYREIAMLLNIKVNNVRLRIFRGKELLRQQLEGGELV